MQAVEGSLLPCKGTNIPEETSGIPLPTGCNPYFNGMAVSAVTGNAFDRIGLLALDLCVCVD